MRRSGLVSRVGVESAGDGGETTGSGCGFVFGSSASLAMLVAVRGCWVADT